MELIRAPAAERFQRLLDPTKLRSCWVVTQRSSHVCARKTVGAGHLSRAIRIESVFNEDSVLFALIARGDV
jgi:hypothetical protein